MNMCMSDLLKYRMMFTRTEKKPRGLSKILWDKCLNVTIAN